MPEGWENIHNREVAFDPRGRRRLTERTETLLTDTGFVDFIIRPALDVQIEDMETGKVREDIEFDWKITDF